MRFLRRTLVVAGLVALVGAALECETSSPNGGSYCKGSGDCPASHPYCSLDFHTCLVQGVDGSTALADLSSQRDTPPQLDLVLPADLMPLLDLIPPPDLKPMCQTSTVLVDCPDAQPVCDAVAQMCRTCKDAGDDATCLLRNSKTPHCAASGTNKGLCVACRGGGDCAGKAPICDGSSSACRACRAHDECVDPHVCNSDGSCAALSDVIYVDNIKCKPGTTDGSQTNPYCDIQDGVKSHGNKTIVRVAGSAMPYGPVNLTGVSLMIVGPGLKANPGAFIQGTTTPGVVIQGTGTSVALDGIEVSGASNQEGILCGSSGSIALKVVRSYVHNSGAAGVSSTKCTLTMDQDQIGPANTKGGVILATTSYSITNCFIVVNGISGPGVAFDNFSSGVFQFNTVANNLLPTAAGGIVCGTAGNVIESSIVVGNAKFAGSQFAGNCIFRGVVSDESGAGITMGSPTFVGASDYHLKKGDANNVACCIDRISTTNDGGAPVLPDHDIDFNHRPVGSGWDVGAHEVQ